MKKEEERTRGDVLVVVEVGQAERKQDNGSMRRGCTLVRNVGEYQARSRKGESMKDSLNTITTSTCRNIEEQANSHLTSMFPDILHGLLRSMENDGSIAQSTAV